MICGWKGYKTKMNICDAILERRTIRKFTSKKIDNEILMKLADFARLAATGANMQPLKFGIITEEKMLCKIFPHTKWAGYLPDEAPKDGERPTAYFAILGDKKIKKEFQLDAGAAGTNIILGAMEYGIASCWLGAIDREEIMDILGISKEEYSLLYLIALGYPAQKSVAVSAINNDIKYYKDNTGKLCVPKRTLEEVIIFNQ